MNIHCNIQNWDEPIIKEKVDLLFRNSSESSTARLLAITQRESGAWLKALPSPNLGTLLDKESLRIALGLRLGVQICHPYQCICGFPVNKLGTHGLSCNKSNGRFFRHFNLNDIIKRGLSTAGLPAMLEPPGLIREDGKRVDGVTLIPWSNGKCLVWDATCSDTLAPSYIKSTSKNAGAAANNATQHKERLYSAIIINHHFVTFSVETMGCFSDSTKLFVEQLGKKLNLTSGDQKSKSYFIQRISLAIQRGNVASIVGTIPCSENMDQIFYLP